MLMLVHSHQGINLIVKSINSCVTGEEDFTMASLEKITLFPPESKKFRIQKNLYYAKLCAILNSVIQTVFAISWRIILKY
jgi:hypothetical protein